MAQRMLGAASGATLQQMKFVPVGKQSRREQRSDKAGSANQSHPHLQNASGSSTGPISSR